MPSANVTVSGEQAFNLSKALEIVAGDMELLKEIASLFIDDYSAQLEEISEGIAQGNSEAINRAAHSLKGSVANFAAKEVYEAANRLEVLGKDEKLAEAPEAFSELKTRLEELVTALNGLRGNEV